MRIGHAGFFQIATDLLAAIQADIALLWGEPFERACVVPGDIAWDECECSALYISVSRIYLTDSFPDESPPVNPCGGGFLAADLIIAALRCAPQPAGDDVAPSCDALDDSAQEIIADGWRVHETTICALDAMVDDALIEQYRTLPLSFVGPAGMCVGSSMTVTVAVPRGGV
jgi:hypothetical protein